MKKGRALLIAVVAIFVLFACWEIVFPYLCNNIFVPGSIQSKPGILLAYYKEGNIPVDFAVGSDDSFYLLSTNKLMVIPKEYFDGKTPLSYFVKAETKFGGSSALPLCNTVPVSLLSFDKTNGILYFALRNSVNSSNIYRLDTRNDNCNLILKTDNPVISVCASKGNIVLTTTNKVLVSYDNGNTFNNLLSLLNSSDKNNLFVLNIGKPGEIQSPVSFCDKRAGICFLSSPYWDDRIIFGENSFKDVSQIKQIDFSYDKIHNGVIFKEIRINNGRLLFVEYPQTGGGYEPPSFPVCYIVNEKMLFKSKDGGINRFKIDFEVLRPPYGINVIYDAVYWKNHIIFATDTGIWIYNLSFHKWFHYRKILPKSLKNMNFPVNKLVLYGNTLYFEISSHNFSGIYSVNIRK